MIALVVSLDVVPGRLEEFTAAIATNAERSFTDEPGCLYFDVVQSLADDHHFVFYELYADEDAVAAHRAAPHFAQLARGGRPLCRARKPAEHPCHATVPPLAGAVVKILVLPGDGIGPEITEATVEVLGVLDERMGLGLELEQHDIGLASLAAVGSTLPDAVLARVPEVDGTILGPVSHYDYPPRDQGGINPSAELRTRFELYANVRPCRSVDGLSVLRTPMDLVIVRENTEGFYSDRSMYAGSGEFMPDADSAFSIRKVTAGASTRGREGGLRAGPVPTRAGDRGAQGQRRSSCPTGCSCAASARSRRSSRTSSCAS